jgi:RecJ-like exonuclease
MLALADLNQEVAEPKGELKIRLANVIDAVHDLRYVAANVLWAVGVPEVLAAATEMEVHEANMRKLVECEYCEGNGEFMAHDDNGSEVGYESCDMCEGTGVVADCDPDGKIVKPEGWLPPDHGKHLDAWEVAHGKKIEELMKL